MIRAAVRLTVWAIEKAVEKAKKRRRANILHEPLAAKYKKNDKEIYFSFVIVDEKELGDGPTLVLLGELDQEHLKELENAIIIGIEQGFKTLFVSEYEKKIKRGELIMIEDKVPDAPEGLEDVVYAAKEYLAAYICACQETRKALAKYFRSVDYQEKRETIVLPKVPTDRFCGGECFLRWKVYEGFMHKRWREYVAPVRGVGKPWLRLYVIRGAELSEVAKKLYESLFIAEDEKTCKKLRDYISRYIKAVIKGTTPPALKEVI